MQIVQVHYCVNDVIQMLPTKVFLEQNDDGEPTSVCYEVQGYQSLPVDSTEFAVKNLQKALPQNMKIAACQTCMFGNFNPYGDMDNEIFCLKGLDVQNKRDVCAAFEGEEQISERSRTLLAFCSAYKPINENERYTYNDWAYLK
ncbi:hypothetical protein [Metasolibacillus meyeri]|uniref:hypothetical protein n=1 Tax=Metasolibacillus meyeri TaxID=1071052 RepID=UPI000D30B338|nr:hypothetical protein [Metasolibacillus meyeri]